jgi:hypothetical protein
MPTVEEWLRNLDLQRLIVTVVVVWVVAVMAMLVLMLVNP